MLETRDLRTATGGPLGVVNRSVRGDTPEDKGSDVGAWGHRNRSQEAASARPGGSGAALSKPRLRSHGANRSALEGDGAEPRGLRLRGFEASGLKLAGCDGVAREPGRRGSRAMEGEPAVCDWQPPPLRRQSSRFRFEICYWTALLRWRSTLMPVWSLRHCVRKGLKDGGSRMKGGRLTERFAGP